MLALRLIWKALVLFAVIGYVRGTIRPINGRIKRIEAATTCNSRTGTRIRERREGLRKTSGTDLPLAALPQVEGFNSSSYGPLLSGCHSKNCIDS